MHHFPPLLHVPYLVTDLLGVEHRTSKYDNLNNDIPDGRLETDTEMFLLENELPPPRG
jgi:hypothetical protein